MSKRKFDVKLRKVGNSYVVTIPKDTIDRFDLKEGDYLTVDIDSEDIKRIRKWYLNIPTIVPLCIFQLL